jgi:two-component system cell cycle sensor histidine kinase/response regulator CckA
MQPNCEQTATLKPPQHTSGPYPRSAWIKRRVCATQHGQKHAFFAHFEQKSSRTPKGREVFPGKVKEFLSREEARRDIVDYTEHRLVGREKWELLGKHQRILHPPEEIEGEFSRTFKAHLKDKGGQALEAQVVTKAGEIRDVSIKANILELKGKKVLQGMFRDITSQKLAERERLQVSLQRAEKMEAVGTLAGGVAHDLNNILDGIVSYPELLLMELPEDSSMRSAILTIQKSGKKAAAIVQDLLTLARRGVSVAEVVKLNDVITEYLGSPEHARLVEFHPAVQFETSLETELLNVLGSSSHVLNTVMNLISNAAEALPHGGKVIVSTRTQYIDRPIRGYDEVKEGDYVVLSVADNGIGISAGDLHKIFEPFYTKKVMGRSGTGLGMAVVWGTVKDLKGYIDVQSMEGKGTTFELYFPVTRLETVKENFAISIKDYMGHGETILVVDDIEEQRQLASVMLTRLGYSVNSVSSGEETVDYISTNSVDLLVLDMIMDPGIDGLETYKRVLEIHPEAKAIIASGFSETDRVKEAQRLRVGQYVKKPYTLEKNGLAVKVELGR